MASMDYNDSKEKKMKLSKAVKIVTKAIEQDPDFRMGYQANIAMAFVDECKDTVGFEDMPYDILHQAANKAADRFLTNWCSDSNK